MSRRTVMMASLAAVLAVCLAEIPGYERVAVMHGSGTTNPSKLIWKVLDLMEERTRVPFHGTYRAIGSGGGQSEFLGVDNGNLAMNHFGSGDIPITSSDYDAASTAGRSFLHIPFVLGGISVFHSVPVGNGEEVKLDGCTLANIFQRNITSWDDAAISSQNSAAVNAVLAGQAINVVRRNLGSSSTALTTKYLEQVCPQVWVIGNGKGGAGKAPFWPSDTAIAEGSDGMAGYLNDNAFSIGYIDSGHGEKLGLSEVALKNKAGVYLKATDADVGAAANDAGVGIPSLFSDSWADVNLLDADGASAWPIVTFSYIYINTDLTGDGVSGALAKAMLEFLLSDECQNSESGHLLEFGFQPLSSQLLTRCRDEVANLQLHADVTPFTFETSTDTTSGSGDYVISTKRQRWTSYVLNGLTDAISGSVTDIIPTLASTLASSTASTASTRFGSDVNGASSNTNDDDDKADPVAIVALILGIVSILLGVMNVYLLREVRGAQKAASEPFHNPVYDSMKASSTV